LIINDRGFGRCEETGVSKEDIIGKTGQAGDFMSGGTLGEHLNNI